MKNQPAKPASEISPLWAKISLSAIIVFMILLTLLHLLKPELDSSWRMISEYAIGQFGWLMNIAFILWAISFLGLFFSIRTQIHTKIGRIGLVLLLISALGLLIAGLFTTDPVTASADQRTTNGMLHSVGGTLGMAMPFAALFLYFSLRKIPRLQIKKKSLKFASFLAVTGFVLAFVSTGYFLFQSNGIFSEATPVGFPNRLEVLCYCIWLIIFSKQAMNMRTTN